VILFLKIYTPKPCAQPAAMDLEQTDSPAEKELPGNAIGVNAMLEFQGSNSKRMDSHSESGEELRRDRPATLRSRYFSWLPNLAFEILNAFQELLLAKALMLKPLTLGGMLLSAALSPILRDQRETSKIYSM
jgi:hypothetical protein